MVTLEEIYQYSHDSLLLWRNDREKQEVQRYPIGSSFVLFRK